MTPLTSTIKNKEEVYPLHDHAKILNNRASHVITSTGNYEEGINLFAKALKLTERSIRLESSQHKVQVPCSCQFCSLDSCLVLMEDRKCHHQCSSLLCSSPSTSMDIVVDDDDSNQQEHASKKKNDNIDTSSIEDPMDYSDDVHENPPSTTNNCPQLHESTTCCNTSVLYKKEKAEEEKNGEFVYQRLLLIDEQSIIENHYMGSTLSLIIIFNLALTHHLMGIDDRDNKESLSSPSNQPHLSKRIKALQHAVKLYEFAYQLHVNYNEQQSFQTYNNTMEDDDYHSWDVTSLRLTMIISNNVGQIHRVAGNSKKYTMCLQHVLSSIMYMGQQLAPNTVFNSTEFDGFIRNVSPLVFHGSICASAA